jgi:uncharacterized membrane protein
MPPEKRDADARAEAILAAAREESDQRKRALRRSVFGLSFGMQLLLGIAFLFVLVALIAVVLAVLGLFEGVPG